MRRRCRFEQAAHLRCAACFVCFASRDAPAGIEGGGPGRPARGLPPHVHFLEGWPCGPRTAAYSDVGPGQGETYRAMRARHSAMTGGVSSLQPWVITSAVTPGVAERQSVREGQAERGSPVPARLVRVHRSEKLDGEHAIHGSHGSGWVGPQRSCATRGERSSVIRPLCKSGRPQAGIGSIMLGVSPPWRADAAPTPGAMLRARDPSLRYSSH